MNSFQDRNGGATTYAFSFPSIAVTDIKVTIDNVEQTYLTHYQVDSYSTTSGGTVNFSVGGAAATYKNTSGNTVTGTPPATEPLNVRVYRQTKLINDSSGLPAPEADFTPGSSIRAADLDDNQTQIIYATQEERDQTIVAGDIKDGIITSAKIADGTIVNADVNASAALAGTKISPNFGSQAVVTTGTLAAGATTVTGNIAVSGTVDGRDVAADGTKLDTIETSAKDDQTAAEIRTLVESASDSNVFTDADHSKLNAIEANATADQTNAEIRTAVEAATDSNVFTDADHSKLNTIEAGATADQTITEIKNLFNSDGIVNAQVATNAAIAGTKITPSFGTQTVTSDGNFRAAADNASFKVGADDDLVLTHTGATGLLRNDTGDLKIRSASLTVKNQADNETLLTATDGGSVDLYHNNSKKLETGTNGVIITGNLDLNGDIDVSGSVTLPNNSITTAHIADAELSTLAGMQSGTASILASSTALTSTTAELNLLDGKSVVTAVSGSSTDVQLPTAKAVNDQILAVTNALGGFVAIADKDSFPTSHPDPSGDTGTVVSISDAGGISVSSAGTGFLATRAGGSDAVVLTSFPSAFRGGVGGNSDPNVLSSGLGLQVQTTNQAHTYTFHKLVYDEGKVATLQAAVDDFDDRYYGGASSNPSTKPSGGNRTDGDLYFNTSENKMKVFNGVHASGTWDDVATPGDFYINTLASLGASGDTVPGGSATFNGTAKKFTLSNPGLTAQQHLVSINGVVQKPMSGSVSSAPTEGFAIDGAAIIFSSAPQTGADYFIVTVGSSVNIGTPSDNTVSTVKIQDDAVTADKLANSINTDIAAKMPLAGGTFTGDVTFTGANYDVWWDSSDNGLRFNDNAKARFGTGSGDLLITHDGTDSVIEDVGTGSLIINASQLRPRTDKFIVNNAANNENMLEADVNAAVQLYYDNSKKFETTGSGVTITGSLTTTGGYGVGTYIYGSSGLDFYGDGGDAGSKLVTLVDGGFKIKDNNKINFGSSDDLQIYHNGGSGNYIDSVNKDLYLRCNLDAGITGGDIILQPKSGENSAIFRDDGPVELYHNNVINLETNGNGITVYGPEGGNGIIYIFADEGDDNADKWNLSASAGGSELSINNRSSGSYETSIECNGDGNVELYYDGTKKLETTSTGAKVSGHLSVYGHNNSAHTGNQGSVFTSAYHVSIEEGGASATLTFSGLNSAWATIRIGGYSSSGQSSFHFGAEMGGYMTGTNMYNVVESANWATGCSISTSKNAGNYVVTITNNAADYNLSTPIGIQSSTSAFICTIS